MGDAVARLSIKCTSRSRLRDEGLQLHVGFCLDDSSQKM